MRNAIYTVLIQGGLYKESPIAIIPHGNYRDTGYVQVSEVPEDTKIPEIPNLVLTTR